jgi:hypothetical protein
MREKQLIRGWRIVSQEICSVFYLDKFGEVSVKKDKRKSANDKLSKTALADDWSLMGMAHNRVPLINQNIHPHSRDSFSILPIC